MRKSAAFLCLLLMGVLLVGCDLSAPRTDEVLVVEAFFDVGEPLPEVRVHRSAPFDGAFPGAEATAIGDARVVVTAGGVPMPYRAAPGLPGRYQPTGTARVEAGVLYSVVVQWNDHEASAASRTPPLFQLDSVRAVPFAMPIRAVLLDSIRFDTLGTGARQGFVYPVEVFAWWSMPDAAADSASWIRAQVRPAAAFSSTVGDFFFPPERIEKERDLPVAEGPGRLWRGLYAVPVESADAPLPPHRVRVALVRSGRDYARFAATRTSPAQREPLSNVQGGRGIVAGLSVDSLTLFVTQ